MKKLLYFLGICSVIGILIGISFQLTPIFNLMGKGFLLSVSTDNYEQAYSVLSDELQKEYPYPAFKTQIQSLGLNYYQSVTWLKLETNEDKSRAYIMGVVLTKPMPGTGRVLRIPIKFEFIKIQGQGWLNIGSQYRISGLSVLNKKSSSY